jgi:UDP-N-acetylglucosamine pyrophosphorylase
MPALQPGRSRRRRRPCRQHFEAHGYFGLQPSQVTFFQQGFLPCLTEQGAIIMETHSKVGGLEAGHPCLQAPWTW